MLQVEGSVRMNFTDDGSSKERFWYTDWGPMNKSVAALLDSTVQVQREEIKQMLFTDQQKGLDALIINMVQTKQRFKLQTWSNICVHLEGHCSLRTLLLHSQFKRRQRNGAPLTINPLLKSSLQRTEPQTGQVRQTSWVEAVTTAIMFTHGLVTSHSHQDNLNMPFFPSTVI